MNNKTCPKLCCFGIGFYKKKSKIKYLRQEPKRDLGLWGKGNQIYKRGEKAMFTCKKKKNM